MHSQATALGAIVLATVLSSFGGVVATDLFAQGITPAQLNESRSILTVLGLALVAASRRRPASGVRAMHFIGFGLAISFSTVCYLLAIRYLNVATAIVLLYTSPTIVVGWKSFARRQRPNPYVFVSCLLAMAGVLMVSDVFTNRAQSVNLLGVSAGVMSGILFAVYTLLSERMVQTYGPFGATYRAFLVSTAVWVSYQATQGVPRALFERDNIPGVLFVGTVGTLAPFFLFLWALQRVKAERASVAATVEPIAGGVLAWLLLGQLLTFMQLVGGLLIISAVIMLTQAPSPDEPLAARALPVEI